MDPEVAPMMTGLIQADPRKDVPLLYVHLERKHKPSQALNRRLARMVSDFCSLPVEIKTLGYEDFPGIFELNYERKLHIRQS